MKMIKVIGVGSIKEEYIKKAINLNISAIPKNIGIHVISVEDESCPENLSDREKEEIKRKEGQKILRFVQREDYVVALTLEGRAFNAKEFQKDIRRENICFVIGGSLGLSTEVRKRANTELSFGPMTYPHQLMRWVLLEQIRQGV